MLLRWWSRRSSLVHHFNGSSTSSRLHSHVSQETYCSSRWKKNLLCVSFKGLTTLRTCSCLAVIINSCLIRAYREEQSLRQHPTAHRGLVDVKAQPRTAATRRTQHLRLSFTLMRNWRLRIKKKCLIFFEHDIMCD